jgi:hypothetical protein
MNQAVLKNTSITKETADSYGEMSNHMYEVLEIFKLNK